ncbi:MAG: GxxExxY protein [Methylacidiphilales bacterium]|nr:GxxExxY protein [Candidatus Methylacidiphilales bacterium]
MDQIDEMKNRVFPMQKSQNPLARRIIGLAMKVHRTLGHGFAETVYRNALMVEFRNTPIAFDCHVALPVMYEDVEVGLFQADLIVEKRLIIELKAVDALNTAHSAQLVNYPAATGIEDGLLLNFGASSLEFKTKTRTYPAQQEPPNLHSSFR